MLRRAAQARRGRGPGRGLRAPRDRRQGSRRSSPSSATPSGCATSRSRSSRASRRSCGSPSPTRWSARSSAPTRASCASATSLIGGPGRFVIDRGALRGRGRTKALLETAKAVKAAGADLLRGGAYKPRTSPYAFRGLGLEGLRMLREVSRVVEIPTVSEVTDPRHVEACVSQRRHAADRHPQHVELRPPRRGRQVGASRPAQARPRRDDRGLAARRRVRARAGQHERRALRARDPQLRPRDAQPARSLGRARSSRPARTCRSSSTRATGRGSRPTSPPWPRPRARPGPTA